MNLFDYPQSINDELFEDILNFKNISIKRIISPSEFKSEEFIQDEDEWVLVLQGSAKLKVEDKVIELKRGDSFFIKSKTPHQVITTSKEPLCIWLAVHIY